MLKRKIYDELINWRNDKRKNNTLECLLINGARQVGKSYIVNEFGINEYKAFYKLDFASNPELKDVFKGSLEADDIYKRMSLFIPNFKIIPNDTLIFIDEIQLCGNARTSLKYLAIDNRCDIIASGSLLGLRYGKGLNDPDRKILSYPVGYEKQITMHSLDFEEFCWAQGYGSDSINALREYFDKKEKVPDSINEKWEELFREYMIVGGMPEVVNAFSNKKDYNLVQKMQDKILDDYKNDITSHAKDNNKEKIRKCYDTIPRSLAKENKKYKYGDVISKATSRMLEDSITWLIDSNMVLKCNNIETPTIPLLYNSKENDFKLYLNDTGLLCALYGRETKIGILNDTLKGNGKGGIYENAIGDLLYKKGHNLHFYKPSDSSELEFIIEKDGEACPIEVKASNNRARSLDSFIKTFEPKITYKLINGNIGFSNNKYTIPHYMIMFI